ncbi:ABC transporter ATP-binding protein [Georgenia sunbinii]|uniref:ABC transporter ATP-binding protein n=1 Tax=Georgenia sunbinii TaxID=3117728 RepID=UPI002F261EF6
MEEPQHSSPSIRLTNVTKRYAGDAVALKDVTFHATPGRVLGLLGRNGAGKTTALRILMGLTKPTAGVAHVLGQPYPDLPRGARRVGTSFDDYGSLVGASGPRELSILATTLGVPQRRAREVLELVGLSGVGRKPVKAYSTGMRRRLNLAITLLADPEVVVLDEPANGLDPDGVRWLRDLLGGLAAEGRTVLLSSHLLAEVEQTVQDVVILQQSVRYSGSLADLTRDGTRRLEAAFFDVLADQPTSDPARHAEMMDEQRAAERTGR